ncbi:hypothetical protein EAL2_c16540 [Peptoclostridium acidaminophilum DSM 3953]|uniref:DUF192 domain-containing protein n=1 Tax=Peptoclostridium acidaminophilum DSM 3953 TaxID=1286171 RepID=W8T5B7_PEPAC|nr:DUF192 domain-containing protein [Peptoclostridium acidaminophilum]AHM56949.1 hypothetical protein EAL2_c16540 [Peptoclostridium acidaminophilum DSM 3953]
MKIKVAGEELILFSRARLANSFFKRFRGLMGIKGLPEGECLVITPCSSIHTFFMKFAIDAAFVDKDMRVLKIVKELRPGNTVMPVKGAYSVIEADSRFSPMKGLNVGDMLKLIDE